MSGHSKYEDLPSVKAMRDDPVRAARIKKIKEDVLAEQAKWAEDHPEETD